MTGVQTCALPISDVIYKLVEAVESVNIAEEETKNGGTLEVLTVFSRTAGKQTIGGKVTDGTMRTKVQVQIIRGEEVVGKGRVKSLQQGKEDTKEVAVGNECGLVIETETKIEKGDLLNYS